MPSGYAARLSLQANGSKENSLLKHNTAEKRRPQPQVANRRESLVSSVRADARGFIKGVFGQGATPSTSRRLSGAGLFQTNPSNDRPGKLPEVRRRSQAGRWELPSERF